MRHAKSATMDMPAGCSSNPSMRHAQSIWRPAAQYPPCTCQTSIIMSLRKPAHHGMHARVCAVVGPPPHPPIPRTLCVLDCSAELQHRMKSYTVCDTTAIATHVHNMFFYPLLVSGSQQNLHANKPPQTGFEAQATPSPQHQKTQISE